METATYIQNLLKNKGIVITDKNKSVIEKFTSNDEILTFAKNIIDTQNMILDKYKIANRIFDIQNSRSRVWIKTKVHIIKTIIS